MKIKSLLLHVVVVSACVMYKATAQDTTYLKLALGVNIINNNPYSRLPWEIQRLDYATPFNVGLDYQLNKHWSVGLNVSTNTLKTPKNSASLWATQADINYYIIPNTTRDYKELYVFLAAGKYTYANTDALIAGPGLGINYWVFPKMAINISGRANVAVKNNSPEVGSYYQCNIGVIWRFTNDFR